ncbi:hypothetical protein POVCU2_0028180 [Plasmodium ovale curtisi]|uniref:Uncharacterized protein n=1 Tax=Plasmodium ovale curtisi TaxID=864141 RepID=A0A1A8VYN4_PLAOA|nr:hypothetical protein POVCU2_0028180 [Plasmodium ovale curtisi]SBS93390.1 hypothetical protein POVCU1_025490 [Plasmodium ovale curtisi]
MRKMCIAQRNITEVHGLQGENFSLKLTPMGEIPKVRLYENKRENKRKKKNVERNKTKFSDILHFPLLPEYALA